MRRVPPRPLTPELELFPFLSVLACTIGTLILLIVVIASQLLGGDREVAIVANEEAGQNQRKVPRYLELSGEGVVLHPEETFVPAAAVGEDDSALHQWLDAIAGNRTAEYVIIAVRPSGIELFGEVRDLVEARELDLGYEPIDEDWTLRVEAESAAESGDRAPAPANSTPANPTPQTPTP